MSKLYFMLRLTSLNRDSRSLRTCISSSRASPRKARCFGQLLSARVEKPATEESLAIVCILTVPNPTSGNLALVAEDDLFETGISVEDAIKLMFSGGIATPDALTLARMSMAYGPLVDRRPPLPLSYMLCDVEFTARMPSLRRLGTVQTC